MKKNFRGAKIFLYLYFYFTFRAFSFALFSYPHLTKLRIVKK